MKEKVVASRTKKKDGKRDKNEWEWFDAERKKKDTKKINRYKNHQNIASFFFIFVQKQKKISLSLPFVSSFYFYWGIRKEGRWREKMNELVKWAR